MSFKHSDGRNLLSEVKKFVVNSFLNLSIAVNEAKEVKIFLVGVIGRKMKFSRTQRQS
jgi:hypothetical protein